MFFKIFNKKFIIVLKNHDFDFNFNIKLRKKPLKKMYHDKIICYGYDKYFEMKEDKFLNSLRRRQYLLKGVA